MAILTNSCRIDSTFFLCAACCACSLSISVSPDDCWCCFGVLSPELLPVDTARFISGLGTFLANSRAFSRTDLLLGDSTLDLAAIVDIDACMHYCLTFCTAAVVLAGLWSRGTTNDSNVNCYQNAAVPCCHSSLVACTEDATDKLYRHISETKPQRCGLVTKQNICCVASSPGARSFRVCCVQAPSAPQLSSS